MSLPNNQGLRNSARSPGSIQNAEHYDPSGASKSANGSPATMLSVIPDSTVLTPVKDLQVIRVANTSGSTQYLWHGRIDLVPGTVNALSAMALAPNSVELMFCGVTDDDMKSVALKSSASSVQIVLMQN